MGFREARWSVVQRLSLDDVLICYVKGHRRFVGALKVIGSAYMSEHPRIWISDTYAARIPVEALVAVPAEHGVPATDLLPKLEFGSDGQGIRASWGAFLQGGPRHMSAADGETILREVRGAVASPNPLPLDPRIRGTANVTRANPEATSRWRQEKRRQIRLQAGLLELGSRVGLMTWAARKDHSYSHEFRSLGELSLSELPSSWNRQMKVLAEDIDVIWIRDAEIFACFEVVDVNSVDAASARLTTLRDADAAVSSRGRLLLVVNGPDAASIHDRAAQAGCGVVTAERIGDVLRASGSSASSPEELLAMLLASR